MHLKPLLYLVNLGVTTTTDKAEANRIRLTNRVAIFPLLPYGFAVIYCLIFNYPRIVITAGGAITGILITLWLNYKKHYSLAKSLLIVLNGIIVAVIYKLMEDEKSMFFFYFPLIMSFMLFYKPKEEKVYIWMTAITLAGCMLCCFFLPSYLFKPFPLPESMHRFIFLFSAIASVNLSVYYVYIFFRTILRNETILNKAKNAAEEASREKALFLNNMSHELRTPLNGIIGTTYLLKDDDLLPGQQLHVHILDSLSQQMLGLVNNVLDYGKIESGKLELHSNRFSISSFMNKLNTNFQNSFRDKSLTYIDKTDSALDEIEVYADDLRLQQVMSNLVSNALKFTEDGSVTASATLQQLNSETVFIVFSVTDTGMGIEEDLINKIFDSFSQGDSATTRKYGGTGLGLTIASNLVKLFNGTLQVKSEKGKGSCFYFTIQLPLYKDQQKDQFARTPFSTERLQNIQLLLVEDNPVNRMVARKIMEKWDIQITEAVNGKDAMEKFNHCEFDIVLLDLEMPEMDGREAIRQIRTINHKIPAIAFTAAFYENMKQDLLQQGFNDYLLKPFKPEDLYQKLLSLLPS